MLDKCKPIVEHLEKKGWRVDTIGQTPLNDLNDIKEDLIYLVFGIEPSIYGTFGEKGMACRYNWSDSS
jgi:hypothetical protein